MEKSDWIELKQEGRMKWPANGRGDEARLERLRDPKSWQTCLDEFSEPDDQRINLLTWAEELERVPVTV